MQNSEKCRGANPSALLPGEKPTAALFRRIVLFLLFTLSCVLFRAQSLGDAGVAFRQMFSDWGIGEAYLNAALSALGMSAGQILQLAVILAAMTLLYRLTEERPGREGRLCAAVRTDARENAALFVYGILAVALFWLALLSSGDVSGFEYFQF